MTSKAIKTIYEIKRAVSETAPHFFSRNTMKFFGQRMKDFHVEKTDHPEILRIWAKRENGDITERFYRENNLYSTYESAEGCEK